MNASIKTIDVSTVARRAGLTLSADQVASLTMEINHYCLALQGKVPDRNIVAYRDILTRRIKTAKEFLASLKLINPEDANSKSRTTSLTLAESAYELSQADLFGRVQLFISETEDCLAALPRPPRGARPETSLNKLIAFLARLWRETTGKPPTIWIDRDSVYKDLNPQYIHGLFFILCRDCIALAGGSPWTDGALAKRIVRIISPVT